MRLQQDMGGGAFGLDPPPGRMVRETADGVLDEPILWISDGRPDPGLWRSVHASHERTGLWPLMLGESRYEPGGPWTTAKLSPGLIKSAPGDHDPAALLARWWSDYTGVGENGDSLTPGQRLAITAPFGDRWPGLAPGGTVEEDAAVRPAEFADVLIEDSWLTAPRLGLAASARGADAPADLGWGGPLNYENDTATYSAVLRSWEDRSVPGRRPRILRPVPQRLRPAARPRPRVARRRGTFRVLPRQHLAVQDGHAHRYAESITGRAWWSFWWD